MVEDGAFSLEINYVKICKDILNLKGLPKCITGSKVMAILLNGWIFPIREASALEGLQSTGLPCLLYFEAYHWP